MPTQVDDVVLLIRAMFDHWRCEVVGLQNKQRAVGADGLASQAAPVAWSRRELWSTSSFKRYGIAARAVC